MSEPTFKGIAFPFKKSTTSFPAKSSDEDLIKQALQQLIGTQRRQRVMRPEYGTDAWKFVFEDNSATLAKLIRTELTRTIAVNERRVVLLSIDIDQNVDNQTIATVQYILPATSQKQTLKLPIQ